jgi:uncharacterized protein (TIGR00730 family)
VKLSFLVILVCLIITVCNAQRNVAIFCSADDKASEQFKQLAYTLGKRLGQEQFGLITGGSRTGLIKEVIDGYSQAAVMPQVLAKYNVHHTTISQENFTWTDTVYTRLEFFSIHADAVIVLPGGFGTLHELMDCLVHRQFGLNKKSLILFNSDGYWNFLLLQFQVMLEQQLLSPQHMTALSVATSLDECIDMLLKEPSCCAEQGLASYYWQANK